MNKNNLFIKKYYIGIVMLIASMFIMLNASTAYAAYSNPINIIPLRYSSWTDAMKTVYSTHPYYLMKYNNAERTSYMIYFFDNQIDMYYHIRSQVGIEGFVGNYRATTSQYMFRYDGFSWNSGENYINATTMFSAIVIADTSSSLKSYDSIIASNLVYHFGDATFKGFMYDSSVPVLTDNSCITRVFPYSLSASDEYIGIYEYKYDASISDVENLKIEADYMYKNGWLVVGESKTDYNITWDLPVDASYKLEIDVTSTYQSTSRRKRIQDAFEAKYGTYTNAISGLYEFNTNNLGKYMKDNYFNDLITGTYPIALPPNTIYFRYVKIDPNGYKLYGNWTRIIIKTDGESIVEVVRNKVDDTDTVVSGTETTYITGSGDTISKDQSATGIIGGLTDALTSVTSAFNNIPQMLGQLPTLFGKMFPVFPPEIANILALGIALTVILRIGGR